MLFNNIKTAVLLALLSGLLMLLGSFFGGAGGVRFALIFSLIMNGIAYFFSDKIVLSMYGAKPLDKNKYAHVYTSVHNHAKTMRLPMPKLWLVSSPMANAFATGRNPSNGSIAVTSGILSLLNERELNAVLAHEMGHIKNRDILISTVAATIASAIGYLAYMLRYVAFWGSMRNERDRQGPSPLAALFVAILMPIAASLVQLAISRSREYLADETGAHTSQDPLALADALEKLHTNIPHAHLDPHNAQQASTASLFIVHPFTGNGWLALFRTHPPMHERIRRLRQLHEKMFPSS